MSEGTTETCIRCGLSYFRDDIAMIKGARICEDCRKKGKKLVTKDMEDIEDKLERVKRKVVND